MKTLYIECLMGAAGDMLMAALSELLPNPDTFLNKMNGLGIPGVQLSREATTKCGIAGSRISVKIHGVEEESLDVAGPHDHDHDHDHAHHHIHQAHVSHEHTGRAHTHHAHAGLGDIHSILHALPISDGVRADALAVYEIIAQGESKAHGKPMDAVHFHEVGMMDAVADIVGVSLLMEELAPQKIIVSPIHVGSGQVSCAHGIMPVPAPATAYILQGIPTYGGQILGELCTPTGAALLKHFAHGFGDRPMMTTTAVGYGMGKKDFPAANCLRVFWGESAHKEEDVREIVCNLDDMTGEELGFATELLMDSGALDVSLVPLQMKKNRPGHLLVCLCRPEDEEKMARLILQHTTSFGVRCSTWRRYTLQREIMESATPLGPVRIKCGTGYGLQKQKPEYEDIARLSRAHGLSLREVREMITKTSTHTSP